MMQRSHRRAIATLAKGSLVAAALAAFTSPAVAQQTLRIGISGLPPEQGQIHASYGAVSVHTNMLFFDAMTNMNVDRSVHSGLAGSWENIDQTTWRFTLRPGVRFHNGKPLTAQQVVDNVAYMLSDEGKTKSASRQIEMASAVAIDDLTVEIKTKGPNPILHRQFAIMRVMEMGAFNDLGAEGFGRAPVGTGPFKVAEWGPDFVDATAFDNGWRKPRVAAARVVELPELASRVSALQTGQIDIAMTLAPDDIPRIEGAGHKVAISQTNNVMTMMLNITGNDVMKDLRVRQALNYAVNKKAFIEAIVGGRSPEASQPATRTVLGYSDTIKPYPYDPAKAKELLVEAGYGNGLTLVAETIVGQGEWRDMFQHIAGDLAQVGIELEIQAITRADLIAKILGRKKWEGAGFSMQYEGFPTADASRPLGTHSCSRPEKLRWICFEEISPLIEQANQEFDPTKREAMLQQAMKYYHDQASALYMYERVQIDGLAKNVEN